MLKYLKKYWFFCLIAPLFMVGEVCMDLLQPDLMRDIVDNGVLKNNFDIIIGIGLKMIGLVPSLQQPIITRYMIIFKKQKKPVRRFYKVSCSLPRRINRTGGSYNVCLHVGFYVC